MIVKDILESCKEIDCKVKIFAFDTRKNECIIETFEVSNFHDSPALDRIDERMLMMELRTHGDDVPFRFIREDPRKMPVLLIFAYPVWRCRGTDSKCKKTGCWAKLGPCEYTTKWEQSIYFKED